jgi:hypothetical protein
MLRINRTHKTRVSNRLAVVAAFMLMISIVAGLDNSMTAESNINSLASKSLLFSSEVVSAQPSTGSRVKQKKGFKVSLFLLRID